MEGDHAKITDYALSLGLLDPRESPQVVELFVILMKSIVSMYKPENQPFDFSGEAYLNNIRLQSINFVKLVRYTSPAKELIFLNRKLGGVFHILKDAKAKINLLPYWKQVLELEDKLVPKRT